MLFHWILYKTQQHHFFSFDFVQNTAKPTLLMGLYKTLQNKQCNFIGFYANLWSFSFVMLVIAFRFAMPLWSFSIVNTLWSVSFVMPPMSVQFCDATYVRSVFLCHLCLFSFVMPPMVVQFCDATYGPSVL